MNLKQYQAKNAELPVHPDLKKHAESLGPPRIIKVRDHVYVAVSYAIANMIMIEGIDGIIIVDTTESGDTALQILQEFRKITSKPIKAIIETHFHLDHINGTAALLETCGEKKNEVKVIAHSTLFAELTRSTITADSIDVGGIQQFGTLLEKGSEMVCCGIGPFLSIPNPKNKTKDDLIKPTHTFDEEADYKIAGVNIKVFHTPGETDDQITVWIPEWKVVMPADNIYRTFPNLYAIRGSPPRDCVQWYESLDLVKRLGAHHMVPSHTEPISGAKTIRRIITHYRDAIQFINDQTVRYLNNGMDVDDIVEKVKLPPSLADHPYLQQHYGMVPWSVRSVAAGHIGWFDKNPIRLFSLSLKTRAEYVNMLLSKDFSRVLSGVEKLLIVAEEALSKCQVLSASDNKEIEKNATWGLELSLQAMEIADLNSEIYKQAVGNAIRFLKHLAANTLNPNARNFFLTKSKELEKSNFINSIILKSRNKKLSNWPIEMVMKRIPYSFIAENVSDQEKMAVVFEFPDVNQKYRYKMRHCILKVQDAAVRPVSNRYDVRVTMNSDVWKELLSSEKKLSSVVESKDAIIDGKIESFERFMNLLDVFQPNIEKNLKNYS